ncbi:MAG TPA: hypothetical protein P5026_14075 [Kiritimatiellia bacterium]|nr:hypothetical protein [Kiritimatiellia bacterium]
MTAMCVLASVWVTWAVQMQVPSVGHGQTAEVVVTNATAETESVVVAGTLRKLGTGRLAVTSSHFTGGTIEVEQGTLALDAGSSITSTVLPSHILTNNLLLWVDATTNVVTDGGAPAQVLRWCDVRETDTEVPTLMYAGRYGDGPGPALASRAWLGAQQYLEFGAMKSNGCWLALMQPGDGGTVTSNQTLTGKSFFAVRGTQGGSEYHGFFFGSWKGSGNNGDKHFHTGSSTAGQSPLFAEEAADSLRNGWVSLDGRRVNGFMQYPHDWYELVGVHLPAGTANFSNFFNDRNYMPPTTNFRQGGGQLAEVLVFGNVLSENDRLAVEAYLQSKWFNRTQQGVVSVRTGAAAEFRVEQGEMLTLSGLDGDGLLVKHGAGALHLRRQAGLPARTLYLAEGALTVGPLVRRDDVDVVVTTNGAVDFAVGGRRVTAAGGSVGVQTLAEAGVLAKDGAGVWSTAEIPQGVTTVRVEAGTLCLAPPAVPRAAFTVGSVPNADFEQTSGSMGAGAWMYNPTSAEWAFMPSTKITEIGVTNQVDKGSGLATPGSPWLGAAIPLPEGGRVVAFVQRSGTVEGTVTLPQAGAYRLTFAHARRTGSGLHLLEVVFDGVTVGKVEANSNFFTRRDIRLPYRAAGSYSLLFRGVHIEAGDRTSLIDDIRLERLEDDGNLVQDGSFEETGDLTLRLNGQTRYEIGSVLDGRGWTFSDAVTNLLQNANNVFGTNVAAAGVAEDLGGWMVSPESGGRAAFLFGDGKLRTTVTFPSGGVYRVSFLGAGGAGGSPFSRAGSYPSVNARHTLDVTFDGVKIAPIRLGPPGYQLYEVTLPAVTQGQVAVIGFEGTTGTNSHSRIGLIDDVRVTYMGPAVVQEGGFENPVTGNYSVAPSGAAWSFTSTADSGDNDTKSGLCVERTAFSFAVPMGRQAGWLQKTASIRQPVTFPEDGYYAVSFMAAARTDGNYSHVGHDFALMLNGAEVGRVTTTDYLHERYTFRLPYVKSGVSYLLAFQGLNSAGGDRSSAIDDVRVTRLPVVDAYAPFPEGLTVELAEDARLALDFAGVQPLHTLRIGGRLVSGIVSAVTHPETIAGAGELLLPNHGAVLLLK